MMKSRRGSNGIPVLTNPGLLVLILVIAVASGSGCGGSSGSSGSSGEPDFTEIIDATGDGAGNPLDDAFGVAVEDPSGNVYVTGIGSDNVFQIIPGGTITEIIDATGGGAGRTLDFPSGVAVDSSGNIYVAGFNSDTVIRIGAHLL